MSNINKAAVLNPFSDLTDNVLEYVPRATTTEFGIVAIGSGINVDILGRIYLDTQEYSDRLTAIEAEAASTLATQKSEVAAAIAQVNLTQSQSITALTLEVNNLKTNLTNSIAATQTDLINRADQLAQDVTDITVQLTQDKATFTQDIQDALDFLKDEASVASALRHPRKIQGVEFDGTKDISLPTFTTQTDGLVPKRVGTTSTKFLREDGTWVIPTNTTYALLTAANAQAGTATTANTISAKVLKEAIQYHAPTVTDIAGNAGSATKLQTPRTISLTGKVTGSANFDGSANASITTAITGLGAANGIATLDSNGQVPSTQLPSYVDDVLEFTNVAAFPTTGVAGKIYVETTGNTTYRWSGTAYVKITSGEVSSVAGKVGVVTLSKSDVGLASVDNTADSAKSVASAAQLTTARTINGTSFNGSANITTANWGTARTLTLGSTGKSVNGSANVSWSADEILPTGTNGQVLKHNGTSWVAGADNNTTYSAMTAAEATTGTATTSRVITPAVLKSAITTHAPVQTTISGNAATATKLATARTINGTSFDGSANITVADSTKLPLSGGTINGNLNVTGNIVGNLKGSANSLAVTQISAIDFNTFTAPGEYRMHGAINSSANSPAISNYGFIFVHNQGDWVMQECWGDGHPYTYACRMSIDNGSTWRDWSYSTKETIDSNGNVRHSGTRYWDGVQRVQQYLDIGRDDTTDKSKGITFYNNTTAVAGIRVPAGASEMLFETAPKYTFSRWVNVQSSSYDQVTYELRNSIRNATYQISSGGALGIYESTSGSTGWNIYFTQAATASKKCVIPPVYTITTASASNVNVASDGTLARSTSSLKYKTNVESLEDLHADNVVFNSRPIWYRSNCKTDNPEWSWYGLGAEDMALIDPRLVHWRTTETVMQDRVEEYEETTTDAEGNELRELKTRTIQEPVDIPLDTPVAEGVQYDRIIPHLLNVVQRMNQRIEQLEQQLAESE